MNKLMLVCVAAAGICGQSATANAALESAQPPKYFSAGPAIAMTRDVPDQLAALAAEVQTLRSQLENVQNQTEEHRSAVDQDTAADPYNIGTGG